MDDSSYLMAGIGHDEFQRSVLEFETQLQFDPPDVQIVSGLIGVESQPAIADIGPMALNFALDLQVISDLYSTNKYCVRLSYASLAAIVVGKAAVTTEAVLDQQTGLAEVVRHFAVCNVTLSGDYVVVQTMTPTPDSVSTPDYIQSRTTEPVD
eukprot:scaffold545120_cov24-Prasinocladus_malaysianus.AAC.1